MKQDGLCKYCDLKDIKVPDMLTNEISQRLKEIVDRHSQGKRVDDLERKLRLILLGANYAAERYELTYVNGSVNIAYKLVGQSRIFATIWSRGECGGL